MELDIKSLLPKKKLNPAFWEEKNQKLDPEVRKKLLDIVRHFISELALDLGDIEDVVITGSIANFNWSQYSDIDLHVIADLEKLNVDRDLLEDYFAAKKNLWNNGHDVKMHGHEVEVYVQPSDQAHHSTGTYSALNDEWIEKPTPDFKKFDKAAVKSKTMDIIELIKYIHQTLRTDPLHAMKMADTLQDRLKTMRTAGLEDEGEFSVENLTYKTLRRSGYLETLWGITDTAFDMLMSVPAIP